MDFFTGYAGTYTPESKGSPGSSGSLGKGIYFFRMNSRSGKIEELRLAAETVNPSWLCVRGKTLYAVNELGDFRGAGSGAVSAFRIMDDGSLELINQKPSGGKDPCHLVLNSGRRIDETFVLAANYTSGTVAVFSLEESGGVGDLRQLVKLEGRGSPWEGPRAHSVLLNGPFAFVHDLGSDQVIPYWFDPSGAVVLKAGDLPRYNSAPGAGPRHGVMDPSGTFLYSVNELDSTVDVLRLDTGFNAPRNLLMEKIQSLSTLPPAREKDTAIKENYPGELCIDPSGKFLCVSNRGHNSVAVFRIRENGTLDFVNAFPSGGNWPRHIAFDPLGGFILAANQRSGVLAVLRFDKISGHVKQAGEFPIPAPACVVFADPP